jgi:hypothetical protein
MKAIYLLPLLFMGSPVLAQQKILTQAIIRAKSEVTFPENRGGAAGAGGESDRNFNFPSNAEGKITAYVKDDMSKIMMQSDFANTTTIVDGKNKKTTTLTESMGRKYGFYTTEEDRKELRERMDSVRKARQDSLKKAGVEEPQTNNNFGGNREEIVYTEEAKKIAGLNCKKAIIKSTNRQGVTTETPVWYCPDFKLAQQISLSGGGMFNAGGLRSLEKINGFPMAYEISRPNGFRLSVEVTKVETDAKIDDKEFDVPSGYDIKPMKDMRGPGAGFGRPPRNGDN